MAYYDYRAGANRIKEILKNSMEVIEQNDVPAEKNFTYENGYYSWVTGIFVDIRDSSSLFSNEDKEKVSKIIRSFTSEVIEILRVDDNSREIGVRGDCVYAIYSTPDQVDILELVNKTFYINTYMVMLNKLLNGKNYPCISVGIGMATDKELIVKAGRKGFGINNLVWIGDAITKASNLSSIGNKCGKMPIVISNSSYINFIDGLIKENPNKDVRSWFTMHVDQDLGVYYNAKTLVGDFNKWINNEMVI